MLENQLAPAPTVEDEAETQAPKRAWLAAKFGKRQLPLEVCKSAAGFYLGTTLEGEPFTANPPSIGRSANRPPPPCSRRPSGRNGLPFSARR